MKEKILKVLSERDTYTSGEELSALCNVSRTAIWKHIKSLKEEGYEIEAQPRNGYKLLKRPDALIKAEILSGLYTKSWGKEYLYTYEEISSTNLIAKNLAQEGKPEGTVVVADYQWAGKGRLGREWDSPRGTGVWVSIILRPNILPINAAQISFVIAVGVVKGLKRVTGLNIKTKWPNDVLIERRKVAGILTEMSAEIEKVNHIVVGIGVNVNQDQQDFSSELLEKATSLKLATQEQQKFSRVEILRAMLEDIEETYKKYIEQGIKPIIREWRENSLTIGEQVEVVMGDNKISGLAVAVDDNGALLVEKENGEIETIIAGDVSLRKSKGKYA